MSSEPLWKPEKDVVQSSFLNNFCRVLEEKKYIKNDNDFFKLWQWTIKHPEVFWSEFWDFCNIKGTKGSKIIEKNKTVYYMTAEPIKCTLLSLQQGIAKL